MYVTARQITLNFTTPNILQLLGTRTLHGSAVLVLVQCGIRDPDPICWSERSHGQACTMSGTTKHVGKKQRRTCGGGVASDGTARRDCQRALGDLCDDRHRNAAKRLHCRPTLLTRALTAAPPADGRPWRRTEQAACIGADEAAAGRSRAGRGPRRQASWHGQHCESRMCRVWPSRDCCLPTVRAD